MEKTDFDQTRESARFPADVALVRRFLLQFLKYDSLNFIRFNFLWSRARIQAKHGKRKFKMQKLIDMFVESECVQNLPSAKPGAVDHNNLRT